MPDSLADADRKTYETGRSGVPWGSLPAETLQSIVALTSRAVADHLHSTAHLLRDDIDFGPMVMARSTVEASGRIAWLLPSESDIRDRVGHGYALRVRGLRDNAKNLAALAALENPCPPELAAAAEGARQSVEEVLERAHVLGFQTIKDKATNAHVGLEGLSEPSGEALAYGPLSHLDVPPMMQLYALWSGLSHSTYDALRRDLHLAEHPTERLGQIYTSKAARIFAAGVATIAAVEALDRLIMYFALDHGPRLHLQEAGTLPAIKSLFLRALESQDSTSDGHEPT
jgi:hypothetical protein